MFAAGLVIDIGGAVALTGHVVALVDEVVFEKLDILLGGKDSLEFGEHVGAVGALL